MSTAREWPVIIFIFDPCTKTNTKTTSQTAHIKKILFLQNLSGTGTGMHYGSRNGFGSGSNGKCKKIKTETPT
jgi:hypothetical protein